MPSQPAVSRSKSFVSGLLPWLIAAAALLVYLLTLNHFVSFATLFPVARVSGWTWQPELSEPLYWLVTYPIHWLPLKTIPIALNLLSVLFAVFTLALLARSVALLPHDRTHEQRQREESDASLLSVPQAWLAPLLAVVVCGLQLTFWENATAASAEMLNLLVFAYVIRCVLEYRIDARESWLSRAAFVYGLGITNNWAMIGFFPLFLAALVWIKGLGFFNLNFLSRMFVYGCLGLLLYLLLPIVQSRASFAAVPFWQGLKSNLGSQEGVLAMLARNKDFRQTVALIGLTSMVPIFVIGIKWASYFGDTSKLGVALATIMFHIVHAFFLVACIWVALDPPFSPRHVGYGIPFLTFYYLGALSVGYFAGYFLLVFRQKTGRAGRVYPSYMRFFNGAAIVAVGALLVLTPLALVARNLPHIRATNGPMFRQMGEAFLQALPAGGGIVLSDDPRRLLLAQATAAQQGQTRPFIFIDSASLKWPDYHRYLKKVYLQRWPGDLPKTRREPISPLAILQLLNKLSETNPLIYLHPSFGYYFEFFFLEPHGLVYKLISYPSNAPLPPGLKPELVDENETFWSKTDAEAIEPLLKLVKTPPKPKTPGLMDRFIEAAHLPPEPNLDAEALAAFYARGLDYWGVDLQKTGQLEKAARHFERAIELNPDNIAAQANLECNKNLQAHRSTSVQMSKEVTDSFGRYRTWDDVVGANGPFDHPTFCFEQGQVFLKSSLYRQAAQEFSRVKQLDPDHVQARLWLAQLDVMAQQPDEALKLIQEVHDQESSSGPVRTNQNQLLFIEAAAHLAKKDSDAADAAVQGILKKFPNDNEDLLVAAMKVYMDYKYFSNALGVVDQQLALSPTNVSALINQGYIYIQLKEFKEAIPPLDKALNIETNNDSALLNRAVAHFRGGEFDAAEQDCLTLQKLRPTYFPLYYILAEIAYSRHDTNAAIRNYELYLNNKPSNPEEIKQVTTRLAELKKAQH